MSELTPQTHKPDATGTEPPAASKIDTDESHPDGEQGVAWGAGFVTAKGAHIPLFIPTAPHESRSGRDG